MLADADERCGFLELELPGQELHSRGASLPAALLLHERLLNPQRCEELPVRVGNVLAGPVEGDLVPVELESCVEAAPGERMRELQDLVDVPLGVVVGEHPARDVLRTARGGEVARGRIDRVLRIPGICDAVPVRIDAPAFPGARHELHPADRAGRAGAHVAAEVRLDLVDRGEHFPWNPVSRAGALPERHQLLEVQ